MPPVITSWSELAKSGLYETFDKETHEFLYTAFTVIDDDDVLYFGLLRIPKLQITLDQATSALERDAQITLAPDDVDLKAYYIKRPRLNMYYEYKKDDCLIHTPGIIRYHGCRVRRGRVTGLVLDRHPHSLRDYVQDGVGQTEKEPFMAALESAVRHLHSAGFAHNDISPANILVDAAGMPVLVNFGSSREIGRKLGPSRGTPGWIDGDPLNYDTSEERHDLSAIEKTRDWLDNPTFDD
ncbi:kinase-like domain-containing protein [Chaetomium strumarium]|uniref:Kinase-like domain-containing protein n=1 Tax=Chaetomium strumarium TaxID=1170767 RepID=A0AAJ0GN81_9PEZI|nr:kinase-like domain-containing protein [Chaetomium strumarium]